MIALSQINNDLNFVNGNMQALTTLGDTRGQQIRERLLTHKGEWDLDINFGVDYRNLVWNKQALPQVRDAHIKEQILLSAGTGSEIKTYEATVDTATRTLSVVADIFISDGTTVSVSI